MKCCVVLQLCSCRLRTTLPRPLVPLASSLSIPLLACRAATRSPSRMRGPSPSSSWSGKELGGAGRPPGWCCSCCSTPAQQGAKGVQKDTACLVLSLHLHRPTCAVICAPLLAACPVACRYWHITNGQGLSQEVRGLGVVGQHPELAPGESFTYQSGARSVCAGFASCTRLHSHAKSKAQQAARQTPGAGRSAPSPADLVHLQPSRGVRAYARLCLCPPLLMPATADAPSLPMPASPCPCSLPAAHAPRLHAGQLRVLLQGGWVGGGAAALFQYVCALVGGGACCWLCAPQTCRAGSRTVPKSPCCCADSPQLCSAQLTCRCNRRAALHCVQDAATGRWNKSFLVEIGKFELRADV